MGVNVTEPDARRPAALGRVLPVELRVTKHRPLDATNTLN
jgi:hypothetical protein